MSLRDQLMQSPSLEFDGSIFYQKGFPRPSQFEEPYIALRKKENRLYDDEIVKRLPEIPKTHPLRNEWLHRKISLRKLVKHVRNRNSSTRVLEIGCGNGWLSSQLSEQLGVEVCAMDINQTELLQGARVFSANKKVCFVCADVFRLPDDFVSFDKIILASSIQYFPDLKILVNRILRLLVPQGEIHIIDSPIYPSPEAVRLAQARSERYFASRGFPGMSNAYFHHPISDLSGFNYKYLFNPDLLMSRVVRHVLKFAQPVFPWIIISS
jgi:ubiquinone/menaquinone biosynthesis C-methylase UbiE